MRACIPLEIIHVGFFDLLVDYLVRAEGLTTRQDQVGSCPYIIVAIASNN